MEVVRQGQMVSFYKENDEHTCILAGEVSFGETVVEGSGRSPLTALLNAQRAWEQQVVGRGRSMH